MDRDCGNMHYTLFDIVGIGNIGDSRSCSEDSYPTVGVTMFLLKELCDAATSLVAATRYLVWGMQDSSFRRNILLGVVLWKIAVFLHSAQSMGSSVQLARPILSCN